MKNESKIVIYQSEDGQTKIDVQLKEETIWLSQKQIANLFETQRPAITKHLSNIFKTGELVRDSVSSILEHTATDGKTYKSKFYNLDAIIAVGYRVNTKKATQFRIWATKILKSYLVNGYALNEKRLTQARDRLEEVSGNLRLMSRIIKKKALSADENDAFLTLICDYAFALDLLDKYDYQTVDDPKSNLKDTFRITTKEALAVLSKLKQQTKAGDLFAAPKDKSFDSSLSGIYQTFDGNELYPALEDKAAHLLYFVVKNHSFVDGNKRIGAFLFVWFLDRNKALLDESGLRRISNETLIALTILVAESNPQEKEIIIKLIKHIIKTGKE